MTPMPPETRQAIIDAAVDLERIHAEFLNRMIPYDHYVNAYTHLLSVVSKAQIGCGDLPLLLPPNLEIRT